MKNFTLVCFILALLPSAVQSQYTKKSALVYLSLYEQGDSLGYNLVNAIPYFFYNRILTGEVALWDGPKKEIQITPELLLQMEQTSGFKFVNQDALFLNEIWTTSRTKTEFEIAGFSFVGKDTSGEKFSFGFIEMKDVSTTLKNNFIPVNINGSYQTTYWEALMHRDYEFNLMQLGNEVFKDYKKALREKNRAFNPKKKIVSYVSIPDRKFLECSIDKNLAANEPTSASVLNSINDYYNNNMAEFLNMGGDKYTSHLNPDYRVDFSTINFSAIWKKNPDRIQPEIQYFLVYMGQELFDTLYLSEIRNMQISIDGKPADEYMSSIDLEFNISRLNETQINPLDSKKFIQALRLAEWNKITYYVITN